MYIKFLKHGKGDPAKAASYLVDDVDHLNRPRPHIEVLRGDPQTFAAIAESIENQWKYTSGVIAWSKDDAPTNDEINEVLDTFEAHAFAGLKPTQYHFTAVLHEEDDGSKHVHFLVPRLELETGKALNIAPPGNQKYFDPLRDYFNYSKGWSRPDNPALQRDTQKPDYVHFEDAAALRAGLKDGPVNNVREKIGRYIEQRVEHGFIRDRKDVLDAISELGEVTRTSDKFISLKIDGKAIRLKGAFYESNFSIESYLENRTREANDARASRENRTVSENHRKLAEQFREQFKEFADKRSKYNANRYYNHDGSQAELEFNRVREQGFSPFNRETELRNSQRFDPTGAAAQAAKSTVRSLEQHEPRDSRNSKDQENPFYIQFGFSFDSSYFAYIEYQSRLRQQEQIQRNSSEERTATADRNSYGAKNAGVYDLGDSFIQSQRGAIDDTRGAVIDDYRAATAAAQRAARAAAESLSAYRAAGADYKRARELHENFNRETQRSRNDSEEISADGASAIRADHFSTFFDQTARDLRVSTARATERVSDQFESRFRSETTDPQRATDFSSDRDRKAVETDVREDYRENAFSRAVSTKISGVNPTGILKALDELDRRREVQLEQERKNDRSFSPRF
jgi:hypothetical protein